jgi:hypothetical protein
MPETVKFCRADEKTAPASEFRGGFQRFSARFLGNGSDFSTRGACASYRERGIVACDFQQ